MQKNPTDFSPKLIGYPAKFRVKFFRKKKTPPKFLEAAKNFYNDNFICT